MLLLVPRNFAVVHHDLFTRNAKPQWKKSEFGIFAELNFCQKRESGREQIRKLGFESQASAPHIDAPEDVVAECRDAMHTLSFTLVRRRIRRSESVLPTGR
jgi:hypothetical protein